MVRQVDELLDAASVVAYLVDRGAVSGPFEAVVALGGGVSNVVLAVESGDGRVVVKQSLPRLRVADEWLAKRERALTEAAALRLAGSLTPGSVPAVIDVDPERCAITIEAAPAGAPTWKDTLLAGHASVEVANRLGSLLARWHSSTTSGLDESFDDPEAFIQLRVDPYHRTVMRRRPDLAEHIEQHVEALLANRRCLVHGDFSPKNVMHGDGWLWVIDFEVAHIGDPAFDAAFLLNHLLLKSIRRPALASAYLGCAEGFWDSYRTEAADAVRPDPRHVAAQLACLVLARVDGKSPAEYLDEGQQGTARLVGETLLAAPPDDPLEAWDLVAVATT